MTACYYFVYCLLYDVEEDTNIRTKIKLLKASSASFHIYPFNGVTESRHNVDKIANLLQFVQITHQVEGNI
jgi:hypothetical protein